MIFAIVSILFIQMAETDFLVNQVQSPSNLGDTQKLWHAFVKFFLQNFLNKIPSIQLFGTSGMFDILSRKCGEFYSELFARVYQMSFPEKTFLS